MLKFILIHFALFIFTQITVGQEVISHKSLGNSIILHSAQEGRMWETIQKNQKVCINWTLGEDLAWQDVRVGCSYRVKSIQF